MNESLPSQVLVQSCGQGMAGVGPVEWLGLMLVVPINGLDRLVRQVIGVVEVSAADDTAIEDREEDFDLVQPRRVQRQPTCSIDLSDAWPFP